MPYLSRVFLSESSDFQETDTKVPLDLISYDTTYNHHLNRHKQPWTHIELRGIHIASTFATRPASGDAS